MSKENITQEIKFIIDNIGKFDVNPDYPYDDGLYYGDIKISGYGGQGSVYVNSRYSTSHDEIYRVYVSRKAEIGKQLLKDAIDKLLK